MTTTIGIIFAIIIAIGLIGFCCGEISGILCCVLTVLCTILCIQEPTALDVYRGKTELEYTVIGGVYTDSIVVFKKDFSVKEEPDYENW